MRTFGCMRERLGARRGQAGAGVVTVACRGAVLAAVAALALVNGSGAAPPHHPTQVHDEPTPTRTRENAE